MGLILLISPRNQGSSAIFTISCFFSVKLEYGVHIFKKSLALKVIIHNMNYVHGVQWNDTWNAIVIDRFVSARISNMEQLK